MELMFFTDLLDTGHESCLTKECDNVMCAFRETYSPVFIWDAYKHNFCCLKNGKGNTMNFTLGF